MWCGVIVYSRSVIGPRDVESACIYAKRRGTHERKHSFKSPQRARTWPQHLVLAWLHWKHVVPVRVGGWRAGCVGSAVSRRPSLPKPLRPNSLTWHSPFGARCRLSSAAASAALGLSAPAARRRLPPFLAAARASMGCPSSSSGRSNDSGDAMARRGDADERALLAGGDDAAAGYQPVVARSSARRCSGSAEGPPAIPGRPNLLRGVGSCETSLVKVDHTR